MPATASDEFLEAAARSARRLAAAAVWHRGRCNWIAPEPASRPTYAALSGNLYNGTAGIALFLAEAARRLDDPRLAATARGAIRHALAKAGAAEGGLYFGPLGVAVAAARVAQALGDESVHTRRLLEAWRAQAPPGEEPHVAGGSAGAILALLALTDHVDAPWLTAAGAERGERLLDRAERSRDGWSWTAFGRRRNANLCGLFHGAAGIGLALLERWAATRDERFREAAERAADYEREWRRRAAGAWPDLRYITRRAARDAPVPVSASWCHGAPGVALARLRAVQLAGGRFRAEAEDALAHTRDFALALLADVPDDPCLCHGAAGIADVLLCAGERELGLRVARTTLSHPALGGMPAGLFTGEAGVGLLQLRATNAALPTPLLIHRATKR
jgi:lantibiotic modifying enzyme